MHSMNCKCKKYVGTGQICSFKTTASFIPVVHLVSISHFVRLAGMHLHTRTLNERRESEEAVNPVIMSSSSSSAHAECRVATEQCREGLKSGPQVAIISNAS